MLNYRYEVILNDPSGLLNPCRYEVEVFNKSTGKSIGRYYCGFRWTAKATARNIINKHEHQGKKIGEGEL